MQINDFIFFLNAYALCSVAGHSSLQIGETYSKMDKMGQSQTEQSLLGLNWRHTKLEREIAIS